MDESPGVQLGCGITCIDAGYIRPGMACFYLMEQGGECAIIETGTSHSVANLEQVMAAKGLRQSRCVTLSPPMYTWTTPGARVP